MYNLSGTQSGLSHGLPLCSEAVRACTRLFFEQSLQLPAPPLCLCRGLCGSCHSACPPDLSRVTRLHPPPVSGILSFLFSSCAQPVLRPLVNIPRAEHRRPHLPRIFITAVPGSAICHIFDSNNDGDEVLVSQGWQAVITGRSVVCEASSSPCPKMSEVTGMMSTTCMLCVLVCGTYLLSS